MKRRSRRWRRRHRRAPAAQRLHPARWPRDAVDSEALLLLDRDLGHVERRQLADLPELLAPRDLLVVNDAATLAAAYRAQTDDGASFELRLAGYDPIRQRYLAIALGAGTYHDRTEDRGAPPAVRPGQRLRLAELDATVHTVHAPRWLELSLHGEPDRIWPCLTALGRPIQYAHVAGELALWHVQTRFAGRPWAFEMPSAGRPLSWSLLTRLRRRGVALAALTHAAGISSTGDPALDRSLPWPERYEIPGATVAAITRTRAQGGRVIAAGTTVVRALESASAQGAIQPGAGVATLKLSAEHRLQVVDGLLTGLHDPGTSHFELLRAFAPARWLDGALIAAGRERLLGHEFGDSLLILPRLALAGPGAG